MKACTKCGLVTDNFAPAAKRKSRQGDGLTSWCRPCLNQAARERRATDPSRAAAIQKRYRERNLERVRAMERSRYAAKPKELRRNRHHIAGELRRRYGLTLDDYNAMLLMQGGRCEGCGAVAARSVKRFHVDHDHACCSGAKSCGRCVRALLCDGCNRTIGHASEDVHRLRSLALYLERSQ